MSCDPYFADVSLLLHCDGSNNSTTFVDSSSVGNTMTANGTAKINTANPMFGTGNFQALNSGAQSGSVSTPVSGAGPLDFGTKDFTIECWLLIPNTFGGGDQIFPTGIVGNTDSDWLFSSLASSSAGSSAGPFGGFQVQFKCNNAPLTIAQTTAVTLSLNTWHHVAIVRSGTTLTAYMDGVAGSTLGTIGASTAVTAPASLLVGSNTEFQSSDIDELRITNGFARYTSNFTPAGPFPNGACVTVPNVVGDVLATGEAAIVAASLIVGTVTSQTSTMVPAGDIISQSPSGGTSEAAGSAVNLVWSNGASYSTPVLSGSIPSPVLQPLQGVLTWTQSLDDNQAQLLLHMDGTNGATSFPDSSGSGVVITNLGATVSTTAPEFGTGCGAFGVSQALSAPIVTGGQLDLHAAGTWTVEGWIKLSPAVSTGIELVFSDLDSTVSQYCRLYYAANGTTGDHLQLQVVGTTVAGIPAGPASVTMKDGNWHAFAVVADVAAGTIQVFVDGIGGTAQGSYIGWATTNPSSHFYLGTDYTIIVDNQSNWLHGQLDEFRVSFAALYTANYTPVGPFTGGGTPASGYDIYRNGVSLARVGAVLTYTDSVPSAGTYDYNVAAYVGGIDVSPQSNTVPLTYATSIAIAFPNCIFDEAIFGAYFGGQLNLVEFTYMPGRTPFEEGATNLIINRYKQEPTDVRQRGVDFTQFVVPGELLQTVAVTGINAQGVAQAQTNPLVTPLVVTNVIIDPVTQLKFGYTVEGGQDGIEYTVQFTTTTNIQTETLEEIFSINIMIEDMFP